MLTRQPRDEVAEEREEFPGKSFEIESCKQNGIAPMGREARHVPQSPRRSHGRHQARLYFIHGSVCCYAAALSLGNGSVLSEEVSNI